MGEDNTRTYREAETTEPTNWQTFWKRFQSPVVIMTMLIMLLNTLRVVLGWVIPDTTWELITNLIVYFFGGTFAAINNPTTLKRF